MKYTLKKDADFTIYIILAVLSLYAAWEQSDSTLKYNFCSLIRNHNEIIKNEK